ncbi:MAG: hypothetical protein JNL01_06195 [Bdellovibrionales bacterium]|nr:hypothetical protein [Bdellovibrionales bacterium]
MIAHAIHLISLFSVFALPRAKADELILSSLRAKVTVPSDWRANEGLLGSEWVLSSPMVNGKRISLQLNTLENNPKAISEENFSRISGNFRTGRLKWANSRKLEVVGFKEPIQLKRDGIDRAVRYEWSYRYSENAFSEVSEYIFCRTGIYHLKAVIPDRVTQKSSKSEDQVRQAMGSFRCG